MEVTKADIIKFVETEKERRQTNVHEGMAIESVCLHVSIYGNRPPEFQFVTHEIPAAELD